ncbi:MAG TPA: DUF5107 domain-containing protein [Roseiflexaceae bacterium]|nr:DUF5107 domain-containing protein [Roseiflexaceae bacterium]
MPNRQITIDTNWAYRGFKAIMLENHYLRAVVLPELGAKIWSLIDKQADREVLWHNPRLPPRPVQYGALYDDWFCGGWDELFPNDAPTDVAGDSYPDHGELWSMPYDWQVDQGAGEVVLRMWRSGVVTPTRIEKQIVLRAAESHLQIRSQIHNDGARPLDFLWKLHPALRISPASRIDLPAGRVLVDAVFRDRLAPTTAEFRWPHAIADGTPVDMRQVPPAEAHTCDFYYAVDLAAGWCALTDTAAAAGFGLAFDPQVFRSVWVFGAYGGWRGLYTTILEPCSGYPYRLEDAIAQGTASMLAPGATLATEVTAVLYRGLHEVTRISQDGAVA